MAQITSAYVDYAGADGEIFEGYVVHLANRDGPGPAILMGHEWSGLNVSTRAQSDRMAELGYTVFALDLYGKGIRGSEAGDNSALMNAVLGDRGLLRRRLLSGLAAAKQHRAVAPDRLAAMGYCFGGLCVLDLARAAAPEVAGVISIHGALQPPNIGQQPRITAKVLILHDWEDRFVPVADVLAIAQELTEAQADWQLAAYGHAQHGFAFPNANRPDLGIVHHPDADRRSRQTIGAFLDEVFLHG